MDNKLIDEVLCEIGLEKIDENEIEQQNKGSIYHQRLIAARDLLKDS